MSSPKIVLIWKDRTEEIIISNRKQLCWTHPPIYPVKCQFITRQDVVPSVDVLHRHVHGRQTCPSPGPHRSTIWDYTKDIQCVRKRLNATYNPQHDQNSCLERHYRKRCLGNGSVPPLFLPNGFPIIGRATLASVLGPMLTSRFISRRRCG